MIYRIFTDFPIDLIKFINFACNMFAYIYGRVQLLLAENDKVWKRKLL